MNQTAEMELAERFRQLFATEYRDDVGELAQRYPNEQRSLWVEASDVYRKDPNLLDDWLGNPDEMREYAERGLWEVDLPADVNIEGAAVRLVDSTGNYIERRSVADLIDRDLGNYVAIEADLSKVSGVKHRIKEAAWECQRCGTMSHVPQGRMQVSKPTECRGCERDGPFLLSVEDSDIVDQRRVKLEEPPGERAQAQGQSIMAFVEDDLCHHGGEHGLPDRAGERVVAFGKYQGNTSELTNRNADPEFGGYIVMDAIDFIQDDYDDIDIDEYRDEFEERAAADDAIDQITESIAPELLTGENLGPVKEAAVAWLFGSWRVDPDDGGQYRGDIHMGIISDPGQGKSQLASELADIAPKSEFRSGTNLSQVGLTAAAVQEEFGGQARWTLEPGVLPRANGGHAIIDEIDAVVDDQTKAIHDALEGDQTVKVDKAGIKADLPTRTGMCIVGNPENGRFDIQEPLADQISLDPALFDRLDLLFAWQDEPDEEHDTAVADHILDSYDELSREQLADGGVTGDTPDKEATKRDVSKECLRAWIAYARQEVFPVMTAEAKERLREFYLEARDLNDAYEDGGNTIPATARRLEAGVRIATAFARAELSDTVEKHHAERAVKLSRHVVGLNFNPETGEFDAGMVDTGVTESQKKRERTLKKVVDEINGVDPAPHDDVVSEVMSRINTGETLVEDTIKSLKKQGELYEQKTDHYLTT